MRCGTSSELACITSKGLLSGGWSVVAYGISLGAKRHQRNGVLKIPGIARVGERSGLRNETSLACQGGDFDVAKEHEEEKNSGVRLYRRPLTTESLHSCCLIGGVSKRPAARHGTPPTRYRRTDTGAAIVGGVNLRRSSSVLFSQTPS